MNLTVQGLSRQRQARLFQDTTADNPEDCCEYPVYSLVALIVEHKLLPPSTNYRVLIYMSTTTRIFLKFLRKLLYNILCPSRTFRISPGAWSNRTYISLKKAITL